MRNTVRRGRPPVADPVDVNLQAVALLAERGYNACTMEDIARGIQVSTRTLHRYFSTKSDIVWAPINSSFGDLAGRLERSSPDAPVLIAISEAVTGSFDEAPPGGRESMHLRLKLIAETPELHSNSSEQFRQWRDVIVTFASHRLGVGPTELLPMLIGSTVQAATMAALNWWATHENPGSPQTVVAEALRTLGQGFAA